MVSYRGGKQLVNREPLENYKLYNHTDGHRYMVEETTMGLIIPVKYILCIFYIKIFMHSELKVILLKFY